MANFISTSHEYVGDLLSRQLFYSVPEHQRDYAWTDDEVSQFWDDLTSNHSLQSDHFLGPIVVREQEEGRHFEIIDGQQRLTTTLILLAAIRNCYHENGDDLYGTIETTYFGNKDRRTREIVPKYTMNTVNNPVFKDFIARIRSVGDVERKRANRNTRATNRKILSAYLFFKQKIDGRVIGSEGFNPEFLADLEDIVKERLSVIQIVVSDEADAYTLFETLNERGIDLSILDLLKNHLFKAAGRSRPEVQRDWQEMIANLDEGAGSKFIRHYWVSKRGRVQASRLYRAIRDSHRSREEACRLSEDLVENSRLYSALTNPEHEAWDDFDASVRDDIATLRLLNSNQCFPVLMASYLCMDREAFRKMIKLMVVMAVRYSLICSHRTGALEIKYADLAHRITKGDFRRAGAVRRALDELYPSDQEFRESFSKKEIYVARHARFLLREIEIECRGSVGPIENPNEVNLEHVAPQKQNQHWNQLVQEKGSSYEGLTRRLGNMVLLERVMNRQLGGADFESKKILFRVSEIRLTADIANYESWTEKTIDARQASLAEIAVARWRYDPS